MIRQKIFSEKFCNNDVEGNELFYVEVNLDNRNRSDIVNRRNFRYFLAVELEQRSLKIKTLNSGRKTNCVRYKLELESCRTSVRKVKKNPQLLGYNWSTFVDIYSTSSARKNPANHTRLYDFNVD